MCSGRRHVRMPPNRSLRAPLVLLTCNFTVPRLALSPHPPFPLRHHAIVEGNERSCQHCVRVSAAPFSSTWRLTMPLDWT
jgi:hypothetical protein